MADQIVDQQRQVVSQWRTIAESLGISAQEQRRLAKAFILSERSTPA
jgi:serine/threonine-protein kinase HipA